MFPESVGNCVHHQSNNWWCWGSTDDQGIAADAGMNVNTQSATPFFLTDAGAKIRFTLYILLPTNHKLLIANMGLFFGPVFASTYNCANHILGMYPAMALTFCR
jgi:hypothetical protein